MRYLWNQGRFGYLDKRENLGFVCLGIEMQKKAQNKRHLLGVVWPVRLFISRLQGQRKTEQDEVLFLYLSLSSNY